MYVNISSRNGVKSCDDPQWSPDGQWIAFVTARSGKKDIWIIKPDGGEAEQVTSARTGVISFKWSPNGKSLAYTELDPPTAEEMKNKKQKNDARVVDENVKMVRLHVINLTDKRMSRLLTEGDFSIGGEGNRPGRAPFDWSPDGGTIVFSHTRTPSPNDWTTADLSLVDLKSGKV